MYKRIFTVCLLSVMAFSMFGCKKGVELNTTTHKLEAPFLSFGPAQELAKVDSEVMQSALLLEDNYNKQASHEQLQWVNEALEKNKADQKRLQAIEIIRMNDNYLFYAKKYLKAQEQYLVKLSALLKEKNHVSRLKLDNQLKNYRNYDLADAKLAFINAREQLANKQTANKINTISSVQLNKGMTYLELRNLLQMPGERLKYIVIPQQGVQKAKKIEPILWTDGEKFLYVEFVNGKSESWKLYKGLDFGIKGNKKVRGYVDDVDEQIVQPAWNLYNEYIKAKNVLAKQKIYNEKAAQQQKVWLDEAMPRIAVYRRDLKDKSQDLPEVKTYMQQAELLLDLLEERLQCARLLADSNKDKKYIQTLISKANNLEGLKIWRTYYTYMNAKGYLKSGNSSYDFPRWTRNTLSKKPWYGSLMQWFKMPSEDLHHHIEVDSKNLKQKHRHDTYVWVHNSGYFYGYFVDDRLISWQYSKIYGDFRH